LTILEPQALLIRPIQVSHRKQQHKNIEILIVAVGAKIGPAEHDYKHNYQPELALPAASPIRPRKTKKTRKVQEEKEPKAIKP